MIETNGNESTPTENPNSDEPDIDITAPAPQYVQNDYTPEVEDTSVIINERREK